MGCDKATPPGSNTFFNCQVTASALGEKEKRGSTCGGRKIIPPSLGDNRDQGRAKSYSFPEDTTSVGIMVLSLEINPVQGQ